MRPSRTVFGLAFALWTLAACSGSESPGGGANGGGGSSPPTDPVLRKACDDTGTAFDDGFQKCCSADAQKYRAQESPTTSCYGWLTLKNFTIDRDALARCVDATKSATAACNNVPSFEDKSTPCGSVLVPTLAVGATCDASGPNECADSFCWPRTCDGGPSTPFTCQKAPSAGEACHCGWCGTAARCEDGTCVARPAAGQACTKLTPPNDPCEDGYRCDGTCTKNDPSTPAPGGGLCTISL